ncbi:hypothetical protein L6R53_15825 [Myxococcota bacterium]|nr:hypothetical protein [Myxococcota bacterium]
MATSALAAAAKADDVSKLSDKTKTAALEEAMKRADKLKDAAKALKENGVHAGMQVVHMAETQGTLVLGSFADGFVRAKYNRGLKVGPVPVRATIGVLVGAWGLYDAITDGGGTHQMAVANGLIGSELASAAMAAGAAVADKMAEKKPAADASASAGAGAGGAAPAALDADFKVTEPAAAPAAAVQGPIREIHNKPAQAEVVRLFDRARRAA